MKTLSRLSRLFDLHIRGGGDLLQRHSKRVFIAVSAVLARSVDELLLLGSLVWGSGFGFRHIASLADLTACCEVRHG